MYCVCFHGLVMIDVTICWHVVKDCVPTDILKKMMPLLDCSPPTVRESSLKFSSLFHVALKTLKSKLRLPDLFNR